MEQSQIWGGKEGCITPIFSVERTLSPWEGGNQYSKLEILLGLKHKHQCVIYYCLIYQIITKFSLVCGT